MACSKTRDLMLVAGGVAGAFAAYARFVRPHVLNWGATRDEVAVALPGDDVVPGTCLQTTRAITIAAEPEHVWPWLAQMGPQPRGGVYTYDWIENLLGLDIKSVDYVLPEYQDLKAGDFIGLSEKQSLKAMEVVPNEVLVLKWEPGDASWTFVMKQDGHGGTRLISRNRIKGQGLLFWVAMLLLMETGSLVMERKMLLGLKERAEKLRQTETLAV